jgi:hypothetical protein
MEYLLKILGGMGKDVAYTKLREKFQAGCRYIKSETLGQFERILWSDISTLLESSIKSGGLLLIRLKLPGGVF